MCAWSSSQYDNAMKTSQERTWRYGIASRIISGVVAAFLFSIAAFFFSFQFFVSNADRGGVWVFDIVGVILMALALFMGFALLAVVLTEIRLTGTTLVATVPFGHNRLLVPHFRTVTLQLASIRSVERRVEVYRTLGLSNMRESLSVVTASGERVGLFSNTKGSTSQLPLADIADGIACAVGITVTDDGTVRVKAPALYGAASSSWSERSLDASSASKATQAATLTVQILAALMLLGIGLRACK